MKNNYSVKNLCEFIWYLEEKYKLIDWKIKDIYIWQHLRIHIYYKLAMSLGILDEAHPIHRKSILQKFKSIFSLSISFFTKNPFFIKAYSNILIPHPRRVNGVEIYSHNLIREIGKELSIIDNHNSSLKNSVTFDIYESLIALKVKVFYKFCNFNIKELEIIPKIQNEIKLKFNLDTKLTNLFCKETLRFDLLQKLYFNFFKRNKVNKVFIVVAYFKSYIIDAAKKLGIKTIELQHGTITKYHLGYSYPYNSIVAYAPEYILTFGRYWSDTTPLPINLISKVIGSPFVKQFDENYIFPSKKKYITFCSQGVVGRSIFDFAYTVAKQISNYKIYFNIHPSEQPEVYENILNERGGLNNFILIYKKPNIFELLAHSEYQVGVFSTTLFEGIVLKNKLILIDLPGIEYMTALCEKEKVPIVKTPNEFLKEYSKTKIIKGYKYFYDDKPQSILKLVDY